MARASLLELWSGVLRRLAKGTPQPLAEATPVNKYPDSEGFVLHPASSSALQSNGQVLEEWRNVKLCHGIPILFSSIVEKPFPDFPDVRRLRKQVLDPTGLLRRPSSYFSAVYSDKGLVVELEMKGYKEEDVKVRVEGSWLVIEGNVTTSLSGDEGGGQIYHSSVRRYEIPPNSDVANIKVKFKNERLVVTVPSLTPSIKKED